MSEKRCYTVKELQAILTEENEVQGLSHWKLILDALEV